VAVSYYFSWTLRHHVCHVSFITMHYGVIQRPARRRTPSKALSDAKAGAPVSVSIFESVTTKHKICSIANSGTLNNFIIHDFSYDLFEISMHLFYMLYIIIYFTEESSTLIYILHSTVGIAVIVARKF
jgi:hypothetical protein